MPVDEARSGYPVTIEATLDRPSRALWLVKWLLLIPHFVVLAFLAIGLTVVWIAAFFAILFTGRYPRPLFDYVVGVMRWGWRVTAYGYGLGGTDRYPPFTLADVPDYPARLNVDYPERLSRGLVLVKWWLLAIPHYIITGLLYGGLITISWREGDSRADWQGAGVIGLLVLVALIVLLVRGTYPGGLFDLVMGLQRWGARVTGYALLLTDRYPPFRLDLGGPDPDRAPRALTGPDPLMALEPPPPLAAAGTSTSPSPHRWTAGRVVALVTGALLVLVSGGLLLGAGTTALADRGARDADGFLTSGRVTVSTAGYAVTTQAFAVPVRDPEWAQPSWTLGTVRARATAVDPGRPLFLGVAHRADVDRYLTGVERATIRSMEGAAPVYDVTAGTSVPVPPAQQAFWISQDEGTGPLEVTWSADEASWVLVLMPADVTPGVQADADLGATLPVLGRVSAGLGIAGAVLLVVGTLVMILAFRPAHTAAAPDREVGTGALG